MSYIEFAKRIKCLIRLIEGGNTGTAEELATRLGVSRRTIFSYIAHIEDDGYVVAYCRQRKTFYFK